MVLTTIPSPVAFESMQCNRTVPFRLETSWSKLMGPLLKTLSEDDDSVAASFEPIKKENEESPPADFDLHSVSPTPLTKREHLTIVKEIKLGSWWWNHNYDDTSVELLKQLLLDQQTEDPEESPSSSIKSVESTTDQHMEECSSDEDENEKSTSPNKREATADRGDKWNERFHELLKFRDERGHCLVPHNWKGNGNRKLAQWVKRQRYQYKLKCEGKHSTLSDERMVILKKVGFVWSRHSACWEERYNELVEFTALHGHCNVPSNYPEKHQLSVWVRCQRRQYKLGRTNRTSTMTPERIIRLNRLGFLFNPRNIK